MPSDASFLVEEFLGAIATQLDRTQDDLALKAVNRPLTYAIKDFSMELKVFVEMDPEGRVRFRTPAANEPGASSVSIGFTTITRPMIQENTVEVGLARSPTLSEAGLSYQERRRLEQVGVRTTAELHRLQSSTGSAGISRVADIPMERLRAALAFGRPVISSVRPAPRPQKPAAPKPLAPQAPSPQVPPPARPPASRPPVTPPRPQPRPAPVPPRKPPIVRIPPATRRIELVGRNMLGSGGAPQVWLGGRPLAVAEADDERIVAELPDDLVASGTLEVDHGDGDIATWELAHENPGQTDPWAPAPADGGAV